MAIMIESRQWIDEYTYRSRRLGSGDSQRSQTPILPGGSKIRLEGWHATTSTRTISFIKLACVICIIYGLGEGKLGLLGLYVRLKTG